MYKRLNVCMHLNVCISLYVVVRTSTVKPSVLVCITVLSAWTSSPWLITHGKNFLFSLMLPFVSSLKTSSHLVHSGPVRGCWHLGLTNHAALNVTTFRWHEQRYQLTCDPDDYLDWIHHLRLLRWEFQAKETTYWGVVKK